MKKEWSKSWNSSIQTRKQRKYVYKAPLHIKHRFLNASLVKELREQYNTRSVPVRKGDTVKVITGSSKGAEGAVSKVSLSNVRIFVEGVDVSKANGSKVLYPIHPSNVKITKLDLSDKRREEKLKKITSQNQNGK